MRGVEEGDPRVPVIRYVPRDPTDMVIQGEQMRVGVMDSNIQPDFLLLAGACALDGPSFYPITQDEDAYLPMNSLVEGNRLSIRRLKNGELYARANAGVATPCGAWISRDWAPLLSRYVGPSDTFTITGTTYTGAGVALAGCRVVVFETGRIAVVENRSETARIQSAGNPNGKVWESVSPVVGETVSDGSGNFSITVPMNVAYQLTGYLTGSPDRAGITKNTVVPGSVSIYLRDPTAADSVAPGSAVFRPIGSPIVRRMQ